MRLGSGVILVVLAMGLQGCPGPGDQSAPILDISGHYEGSLTTDLAPSSGTGAAAYERNAVSLNVEDTRGTTLPMTYSVQDASGKTQMSLQVTAADASSVTLQATPGMAESMALALGTADTGCYAGNGSALNVTLCASATLLSLEIKDAKTGTDTISLVLHRFNPDVSAPADANDPANSQPQAYTLTQAIARARTASFESRIEYEHVVQAKDQAKAAYEHLLPQITLATLANNIVPSWSTALQDIGDLAPFLLPNRWFQAEAASDKSKAEQDTDQLMSLDMGVEVEGLYYAYERDVTSSQLNEQILKEAISIRNEVKVREDVGQYAQGSTETVDSIVNQLQQSQTVLEQVLPEDLAAISAALGFFNPQAVTAATVDTEPYPVESAPTEDYASVDKLALGLSIELDQMDDLIAAAGLSKTASYFSWLDPYADPNFGLGAALPAEVDIESSQIQELKVDRDQVASIISQKALDAVTDYTTAVQSYQEAAQGVAIQQSLLSTAQTNLAVGKKVDLFGLIQVFQDLLAAEINQESAHANYRVARSEIDRLTLQGYYANF